MSGGKQSINYDDNPLFTGTHDGADSASVLQDIGAMFQALGCVAGLYIENATEETSGAVASCNDDTVTLETPITWNNGDTYNIYKTDTKGSVISYVWVDVSRGWAGRPENLVNGWREEDVDLDDHGKHKVWGPGQPEK